MIDPDDLNAAARALYRLAVTVVRSATQAAPDALERDIVDLWDLARVLSTDDERTHRRLVGAIRAGVNDSQDYIEAGTVPVPPDGLF